MENMTIELVQMIDNGKIEEVKAVLGLNDKRSTQNKLIKAKHAFLKEAGFEYEKYDGRNCLYDCAKKEVVYFY